MPQAGYVYVVHAVGTNCIKVGHSTNLQERLRSLAQGVPFSLQLLSAQLVHDSDAAKQACTRRYAPYSTGGDWFALPDAVLAQWPVAAPVRSFWAPVAPPARASRRRDALRWLRDYLSTGEVAVTHVSAAAHAVGITKDILRRAKEALGVESHKAGYNWYWRLPPAAPTAQMAAEEA